jgi:hypothetical protein
MNMGTGSSAAREVRPEAAIASVPEADEVADLRAWQHDSKGVPTIEETSPPTVGTDRLAQPIRL